MSEWRLSRGKYLLIWLGLVAVQVAPMALGMGLDTGMLAVWVVLWQLVKVVPAVGRMTDLGRAPDDAFFGTVIPLANVYVFFGILLGGTPRDTRREKLLSRWRGQTSWFTALVPSLKLMARTAAPGLVGVVVLAVPQVLILNQIEAVIPTWSQCLSPGPVQPGCDGMAERLGQATQAGLAVTALLGLYTVLQLAKRKTVSPASWIPAVFFVPTAWVTGALLAAASESYGTLVPLHVGLVSSGVIFAWHSIVGAAVVLGWVLASHAAHEQGPASLSELWSGLKAKYMTVMPAHAGRVQLVWIGGQVIVPGLFYWVYAAFVVMVGALEDPPSHPLTTRSGKLTWGMMSRLVKLAVVYVFLILLTQGLVVLIEGPAVANAVLMMDASQVPLETQLLVEVLGTVALWWVTVVLYLLYRGRVQQLDERREAQGKARAEAEAAGA